MISPADVEGTAEAIYQALTMPLKERRRRAENCAARSRPTMSRNGSASNSGTSSAMQFRTIASPAPLLPDGTVAGETKDELAPKNRMSLSHPLSQGHEADYYANVARLT